MKIDYKKMRNELIDRIKRDERRAMSKFSVLRSDQNIKNWQCKEGDHSIDNIPYIAGRLNPNRKVGELAYSCEVYVHKNVGPDNRTLICMARTYKKKCFICDYISQMRKEGGDQKEIDSLLPAKKPKSLYNIICYDTEEEIKRGIQIFDVSTFYMQEYLRVLAKKKPRPGRKGIDDRVLWFYPLKEEGKSIDFTREDQGKGNPPKFLGHKFVDRDYDITDKLLEEAYIIDELLYLPTYEEQEAILFGEDEIQEDEIQEDEIQEDEDQEDEDQEDEDQEEEQQQEEKEKPRQRLAKEKIKKEIEEKQERSSRKSRKKVKEEKKEENKCPYGHKFGIDTDEFDDDCNGCDKEVWEECGKEQLELNKE